MDIDQLAGTRLGNYEIESLLGQGGMGVVYKARQISLNRHVALKILPPRFSSDPSFVKRFQREAQAVAQLDHQNIVQIFDISKAKGLYFFSMQYVEGKTLDTILKEKGRLDVDEAIGIVTQAAQGIEHAHRNGIIHRDIKPSNIILDKSGAARIMDFGLARSTEERSKLTLSGTLMGTLDYMSPEQCQGDKLDGRTDIYSLGVVLYEVLSGRTPFEAPNEAALINKIINEDPPDIQTLNPNVPISLSKIIFKALAKDKDGRYSEVGDLVEDLRARGETFKPVKATIPLSMDVPPTSHRFRRVAIAATVAAILVCMAIIGVVLLRPSPDNESTKTESTPGVGAPVSGEKSYSSIAVLPFADMSPEKDQQYFCDGMAEELINALAQIKDLRVIARTSSFSFKGKEIDVRTIGKKLNVEALLEGSVRKSGNRVRITAQLVDTQGGHHLWSDRYDRELRDIFAIQDEITKAIVDRLKPRLLSPEGANPAIRRTENPEAYDLCLRGQYFFNEKYWSTAIEYFEKAIEKDPNFALPYVGLAQAYNRHQYAVSRKEDDCPMCASYDPHPYNLIPVRPKTFIPKAMELLLKALEIDDTLSEAHMSLGWIKSVYEWDWAGGEKEFKRAIELNPGNADNYIVYAQVLSFRSRSEEAIEIAKRGLELDPLSPSANQTFTEILNNSGRYEESMKHLQESIDMFPHATGMHITSGVAYLGQSLYAKAFGELRRHKDLSLDPTVDFEADLYIGTAYALIGETDKAKQILSGLERKSKEIYVPPYIIASLNFAVGDDDKAYEWLDRAYEEHDYWLCYLNVQPGADLVKLRSDSRFQAMLKKIGLDK